MIIAIRCPVGAMALAIFAATPATAQKSLGTPPAAIGDRMRVGGDWGMLDGPFDIAALGPPRSTRYLLERTNLVVDRQGAVLAREVTSTVFRRDAVGDAGGARFTFERFAARRHAATAPPQVQEIPLPGTPTFVLDTATFALSMVADVPAPEMNAAEFRVLVIDALTWDLIRVQVGRPGTGLEIGQQLTADRPEGPQPVPGGTYVMGAGTLRVAGITRMGGEPCLQLAFAIEGSGVSIETDGVNLQGQEYFRGMLAVSLRDGRVVAGQLWGPVVAALRQPNGQELPVGGIVQYVTLREVAPDER